MSPSIRSPTILLFLLLYANNTICWNILETSEILDQLQDIDLSRNRRNSEDESPIWMEYEFGTGVGNREDLVVSNISVHRYPKLPETATDWQFLDVNGTNYLFRTEKSTLFFYKFDSEKPAVDDPVNLHVDGAILTFKVISLRSEFDIVAVLCVESANGTLLRWYKLVDGNSFEFFWSWPIQKRIKDITFIQHEEPYKILLLNDNDMHIGPQYSFIDVYGFNIELATDTFHFWLHHRSFVPSALDIQVCSVYENILLAVQTANDVLLYEYRNTMETNIFQNVQTIKSQDLQNFVCFESGYLQFLAISGPEAGLFHSVNGEFQFNTDSEFDVSEITWVGSIRLDTYRDESLLLIQLKNSTVSALAWQGLSFKKIQLPNNILDRFDLSKITPLPKYGFIFGNRFVKLHTELKSVKHPIQYTTERLLILQRLLNVGIRVGYFLGSKDTLNHQEKILDETEARLNKSYLVNPVVTGFWNLSIVNATNATISDNVIYQSVTLGATNLTNEDLAFDTNKFEDKLKSVQEKLDKIDAKLTSVVDSNSGELRLDSDVEIFGNINVTGNLYVRNLTALSINDFNITTDSDSSGEYHVIGGNKKLDSIQAENLTVHTVNGIPIENIRFGDVMEDYSHVDFSRINRAEIDGHLSFSTINGIDWKTLMKNIVWKDKSMFIPGDTVIEGTLSSDIFKLVIVNDLFYPEDYVLMSSTTPVIVTGRKSFDFVLTTELGNVTTLNGVDFQDYVILNKENVLKKEMTFENLTIDGELRFVSTFQRLRHFQIHHREATDLATFVKCRYTCRIFFGIESECMGTLGPFSKMRGENRERKPVCETREIDTLNHQEKILDETEARLNKSYLVNPVVTGFWNLSIVNATNATISDNVIYQSVTLGATNLTNEDLAFDTNKFEDKLKSVQEKLDKIDAKLTSVVDSNSGELRLDSDVEIFGNINVTGNLYVRNLTALSINDFNITTDSDSSGEYHVIGGNKKLDSIQAENLTVHTVNGIPIENIRFGDVMEDYSHVDFSRINRAEIDGHLSFSTINGIDWKTLMKNIVWKDKSMFIPGDTVIEGTLSSDIFKLVIVNDLFYPEDYVLMSSTTPVIVTGRKSFDFVLTTELGNVTTLNGVDFQDYVILNKENVLKKEMTFENLTIDGELRIDGDVTGLNMTENKLLNETCNISSDIMFLNLNVLGNVTYDTLFMNKRPLNLGDLLLRTDKEVEITGTKTFLNNVAMKSNVTITSGMVNGHLLDEFATTDTDQVFPNLIEILPNVTFGNVTFGATKKLEDFLKQNTNSSGCLDKAVVFKSPITVDELFFDTLNGNISYEVFNERVNETFRNVSLENLIAETVFADEITSKVINGLDFDDFVKNATSANIIDEYITDRLEADRLNVSFINGMSIDEIKMLQDKLDDILHNIRNGNVTLDSLQVTGMITTNLLNGKVFTDLYNEDEIDTVIFKEDVSIQNLTILGLLNGFNFTELVLDTVLKTDTNITIDGFKVFDRINCDELHTSFLNGRPIENLLDPFKDQVLTGPVVVNGTVTVLKEFNTSGNIGDVPFYDLMNRFKSLGNNTYELHGNVRFPENTTIENLHIDGLIYGRNFDSFLNSVVFINEDNVTISGTKVFKNSITFNDEFTVRDKLNDVDLKRFQEKAIFINKPFSVKSKIIFKNGIKVKKNVQVGTKFETKSIMGIDVNDLKYNILYLNRPNHIEVPLTFTNVIFESNVQVEKFNDLDMKLLIPLHTDQMIPVPALNCRNVTVEKLQILGRVNEQNLQEIQDTTFMMTGDQDITGHFNFRGKVHIHHDFNPRFINGIDTTTFIPLNSRSPIVGNFVFESPVYFNKSLRVLSYLNGIDPSRWKAVAVTSNDPLQQFISGKWTVFGNVYFKKGSSGSDILNGINVTDVSNTLAKRHLEMDAILDEKNENLDSVCEDLTELKRYAEKQIYQFNAFDYLQSIKFDNILVSAYHFELDDLDYLLLSYNTCQLHTFLFTGTKFELIGNVSDFGVVEQWTTFRHYQVLYFLTSGRSSCGRSPVNLWMLKNNEFQHVLDLGHNIDSRKVNQDVFLMLINNREQLRSSGRIIEELEKSLSPVADDDDMQIVLQTDQMLLSSKHGIYEYNINRSSNSSLRKSSRKPEILNFEAGFLQKEMFLYYDKEVSKNRIFIGNNDGNQKKILQTIKAHRPTSFVILNFDGAIETLLVFIENKRKLRIYEYKGIQGFVYKDIIKMNVDNLFSFKIRKYPNMAKRYCLALFRENKLTILEALMYGEKLDMGPLTC
ncbi:hypothetical protein WN48_09737 [Eufriesea mexicana]|uniref:Uncharacterized protein n=1 Tax=Eufriesea mexicana TaxID=516756 RepID=A0A310SH26_9HYME|nr:hypothetical protein WN48_09737 [Eufriesea mexicana]